MMFCHADLASVGILKSSLDKFAMRPFWHINMPSNSSWSWRKILQSREWCRVQMVSCIGNGQATSTTKNRGYLHLNLTTDNSVAKFSNGFATDYTYIIFLILATDFSNG